MNAKELLARPWFLPALSALCFVLAFYPFNFGVFALVALAPLRLFASRPDATDRRTFWGAFGVGASFAAALCFTTLAQFRWVYEAYIFTDLVRLSSVPIILGSGALCGLALVVGRRTRSSSPLLQAALGAAIYTLVEVLISLAFKGYYFGTLAYALVDWRVFLAIASYGGTTLATAAAAFVGFLLAEVIALAPERRPRFALQVVGLAVACLALAATADRLLPAPSFGPSGTLSVALVQSAARGPEAFATKRADGRLSHQAIEPQLRAAAASAPDLIVYPFSPVSAAVRGRGAPVAFDREVVSAEESEVGDWALATVGTSTSLALWYTELEGDVFSNELVSWRAGVPEARYAKRHLYPFMDYTPGFAKSAGLFSTPVDMTPGAAEQRFAPAAIPVGALVCSEVNDHALARETAASGVAALLSVGSEAMFADDVAGAFNLASARFRAAENGLPVVRATKFGPSAVIDERGEILTSMPFGSQGVAIASLDYRVATGPRTVYGWLGALAPAAALALPLLLRLSEWLIVRRRRAGGR